MWSAITSGGYTGVCHFYYMWPKAGFHTHNGNADFSPPLDFYINELTIHVCIIANGSWSAFPGASFLGLSDVLKCSGGLQMAVVWKVTYLAGNHHMTGQKAWPSNWLLFVISRTWMGLRWDLLAVSTSTRGKPTTFMASYHPWPQVRPTSSVNLNMWKNPPFLWLPTTLTSTPIWSFVIVV